MLPSVSNGHLVAASTITPITSSSEMIEVPALEQRASELWHLSGVAHAAHAHVRHCEELQGLCLDLNGLTVGPLSITIKGTSNRVPEVAVYVLNDDRLVVVPMNGNVTWEVAKKRVRSDVLRVSDGLFRLHFELKLNDEIIGGGTVDTTPELRGDPLRFDLLLSDKKLRADERLHILTPRSGSAARVKRAIEDVMRGIEFGLIWATR